MRNVFLYLGALAGLVMPLFNIPFILKIRRNKSAGDVSLAWAYGIWVCIVLMLPQVLLTDDWSYKIFGIVNFFLFSALVYHIRRFGKK